MDFIREKIGQIGGFLALIGVVSSLLSFFNYNLRILMWVDAWGTTTGWIIRGALVVVGLFLLLVLGKSKDEKE